jgi:hypothetical protein
MKCQAHTAAFAPLNKTVRCLLRQRLAIAVALLSLLAGCFPYRYTERPGISGLAFSSAESAPIRVATVRVTYTHPLENFGPVEMVTAADGSFHFPPKTFWGVYFIPQHMGHPGTCKVVVTAEGYEQETREFRWWQAGPSVEKLGTIELRRSSETPDNSIEPTLER